MAYVLVELATDIVSDTSNLQEALFQLASIGFVRDVDSPIVRFRDQGSVFIRGAIPKEAHCRFREVAGWTAIWPDDEVLERIATFSQREETIDLPSEKM